jgi:C_GCAxxG_C_C family probable redox protein
LRYAVPSSRSKRDGVRKKEGAIAERMTIVLEHNPMNREQTYRKRPEEGMNLKELEEKAIALFGSGLHCAEIVFRLTLERFAQTSPAEILGVASGFGGGIGKTHEEVCGALSGGVLALGYLYGRIEPDEDIVRLNELVSTFRKQFVDRFGATNCKMLLQQFGPQKSMAQCKRMTAEATTMLVQLLAQRPDTGSSRT